jgi:stage III sporulation protein SpoIIIAA
VLQLICIADAAKHHNVRILLVDDVVTCDEFVALEVAMRRGVKVIACCAGASEEDIPCAPKGFTHVYEMVDFETIQGGL